MNIAVIGCGGISGAHVRAFEAMDQVTKIFVYDKDNAKAIQSQGENKKVQACASLAGALRDAACAVVCTPNQTRLPVIQEILAERNIPILCEKPLSTTVMAATSICEIVPALSTTGFNYRFNPIIRFLALDILDKKHEDLVNIDIKFNKNSAFTRKTITWRDTSFQGSSSAFGDLSSHLMDLVEFISGETINKNFCKLSISTRVKEKEGKAVCVDDNSVLTGFTSGRTAFRIKSSKSELDESKLGFALRIQTTKREISYSSARPKTILVHDYNSTKIEEISFEKDELLSTPPREIAYWSDSIYYQNKSWIESIKNGTLSNNATINQGLHIQKIIEEKIHEYHRKHRHSLHNIKAVASDIDGTLLNSQGRMSDKSRRAIHTVITRKIPFIFASGRHYADIKDLLKETELDAYIVSANGACILDKSGKQLRRSPLSAETIAVLRSLETARDVVVNMYQGDKWIFSRHEDWVVEEHARDGSPVQPQVFIWNDFQPVDVIKYFFTADTDTLMRIEAEIRSRLEGKVNVFLSCKTMLEVVSIDATKSRAIDYILTNYHLSIGNCLIFGDGMNDYDMLSKAGKGVLMGNSNIRLKELLPTHLVIGTNDDDSVAEFIEAHLVDGAKAHTA